MRILILSDMHSNLEALNACLEVVPSCDKVANLGDIVGYGGSPNEVTAACPQAGRAAGARQSRQGLHRADEHGGLQSGGGDRRALDHAGPHARKTFSGSS